MFYMPDNKFDLTIENVKRNIALRDFWDRLQKC